MGKGSTGRGKGDRTKRARVTVLSPAELREKRERSELAKMEADDRKRQNERNPDHFGVNEEALKLQAFSDVVVKREGRKSKPIAGWRTNVFTLLAGTGTLKALEADAGQRLLVLYAEAHGLDGGPDRSPGEFYDKSKPDYAYSQAVSSSMTRKHRNRLDAIFSYVGPSSAKLLLALCIALVRENRPIVWRGIVQHEFGTTDPEKQVQRVKTACEDLAKYFHEEKRRAA